MSKVVTVVKSSIKGINIVQKQAPIFYTKKEGELNGK